MLTIQDLGSFQKRLSKKTRQKGDYYFEQNLVKDLIIKPETISAKVHGSQKDPYTVEISQGSPNLSAKCSCPIQYQCKHIAATLISTMRFLQTKNPALKTKIIDSNTIKSSTPERETIDNPEINKWIEQLSLSQINTQIEQTAKSQSERTLLFVLNITSEADFYLSFISAKPKKAGGFAKANQINLELHNLWSYSMRQAKESLTNEDWDIVHFIQRKVSEVPSYGIKLNFPGSTAFLKRLIDSNRCFLKESYTTALSWGDPCSGQFQWNLIPDKQAQKLDLILEGQKILLQNLDTPCYFDKEQMKVGPVNLQEDPRLVKELLRAPLIPLEDVKKVRSVLSKKSSSIAQIAPKELKETLVHGNPKPHLTLSIAKFSPSRPHWDWNYHKEPYEAIAGVVKFKYGTYSVASTPDLNRYGQSKIDILTNGSDEIVKIHRKLDHERKLIPDLTNMHWIIPQHKSMDKQVDFIYEPSKNKSENTLEDCALFIMENQSPILKKRGWEIELDPSFPIKEILSSKELFLDVSEAEANYTHDWFDIKLGVMINGESIDLLPALFEIIGKIKNDEVTQTIGPHETLSVLTKDGKLIKLPKERLYRIAQHLMVEFVTRNGNDKNLRVSKWNAGFLAEFAQGEAAAQNRWIGSEKLKDFAKVFKKGHLVQEVPDPKGLKCELRAYQKEGVNWLQFLSRAQMNGILADDMGLGKTVQTLAHILLEKESGRMKHPSLVIAPTSLMPNWFNEASRLAPDLKVLILHGNDRRLHFSKIKEFDLILTTYPLLMRDKEFLLSQEFHMIILDEAQFVKNFKTQAYQVIQQIKTHQRLCLSGTPMENHLGELWSLFHLLLPGFLGDQKAFQAIYRKPIEKEGNVSRREALSKRIKPFILRRTKQQVVQELPEKTEIIQKIELKAQQRDLYEAIRLRAQNKVMKEIEKKGLAASQIIVLDALLKLRQTCCDPRLVKTEDAKQVEESAKLECLMEMLSQMIEEKRKILIFSQFTSMLDLIAEALDKQTISYTILTGQTKDRSTPVNEFQNGPIQVMLISLKAGGVGLNLTAADTVIHYDPWWNPAVENQATDRAHRIGQKRAVFVYKLVVAGSLEEKILDLQERKKGLAASMLDGNSNVGVNFSMEDLEDIFKPLPQPT